MYRNLNMQAIIGGAVYLQNCCLHDLVRERGLFRMLNQLSNKTRIHWHLGRDDSLLSSSSFCIAA